MSTVNTHGEAGSPSPPSSQAGPPAVTRGFWAGRSELVLVGLLFLLGILFTIGTLTMNVQGEAVPGPRFFPVIVCVLLFSTGTALAVSIVRRPRLRDTQVHPGRGNFSEDMLRDLGSVDDEQTDYRRTGGESRPRAHSDWKTLGQIAGAVVLFILLLQPVGWIVCAALLFWVVARAMGSTRPVFDLGVALLFSSAIQLAFNAGLGLPLPPGLLEGLL